MKVSPPSAAETSSAYRPAALITVRARIVSRDVRIAMPSGRASPPSTPAPGSSATSRDAATRARARTQASASTMPLDGDQTAAAASTCGWRRRTKARSTISRSVTPLACPRFTIASSAPIRSAAATISLPHRSHGTPWSAQNA